jgi:hypothetical protein
MSIEPGHPLFLLQIVDAETGVVARLPGGGALEADLVDLIVREVVRRGVGWFRSTAHVEQDIKDGTTAAIYSLKDHTRFLP